MANNSLHCLRILIARQQEGGIRCARKSGWTLPLSGNNTSIEALNNDHKSGSFYNLLSGYGLTKTVTTSLTADASWTGEVTMPDGKTTVNYKSGLSDGEFNIAAAPLYFVRSGDFGIVDGRLWHPSLASFLWSRTAAGYSSPTSATAYLLYFDAGGVAPSGSDNRWHGFSLRCLALYLI